MNREYREALHEAHRMAANDGVGLIGYGVAILRNGDGDIIQMVPFGNLITDSGDAYYAAMAITGVSPSTPSAPTFANGMKLGTGTTTVAKNGTAAALITYISGSNTTFFTSYPQTVNLGAGLGVNAAYQSQWAAGVATNGAITEAVIVTDAGSDATSSVANTYHRAVFTAINKTGSDTLTINWNAKHLGA